MSIRRINSPERLHGACHRRFATVCMALLAGLVSSAFAQEAKPDVPAAPLTRYIPRDDLVFLAEFDGLAAHEKVWRGSAAYKLLNETKLGILLEDLIQQGVRSHRIPPTQTRKSRDRISSIC